LPRSVSESGGSGRSARGRGLLLEAMLPMQSPILVPGGAGFIGSHLCQRLLAQGHEVIALDDLSSGDANRVAQLRTNARFELLRHDIARPLPERVAGARSIFNLACAASPAHYQRDPVQTTLSSVLGIRHLLELCRARGARLLQASASEVYGDPQVHPQTEAYRGHVNAIGPRACYDEGKRCAETLAFAYHRQYRVPVRVARLFNVYGPGLRPGDGRVISSFIVQALRDEPLTIYGDGRQTRSFCYVDDVVDGLLKLMDADVEGPINLGNPRECSVLELAELVLRLTGSHSQLVHRPLPPDDPKRRCPDIARAQRLLRWEPRVGLEDGLRVTIDHIRRELDLPAPARLHRPRSASGWR
jgi:UDP-glucuronate decarboxylase